MQATTAAFLSLDAPPGKKKQKKPHFLSVNT